MPLQMRHVYPRSRLSLHEHARAAMRLHVSPGQARDLSHLPHACGAKFS